MEENRVNGRLNNRSFGEWIKYGKRENNNKR